MADPRPAIDNPSSPPSTGTPPRDPGNSPPDLPDNLRSDAPPAAETELWHGRTRWMHFLGRLSLMTLIVVAIIAIVSWGASSWKWSGTTGFLVAAIPSLVVLAIFGGPVLMVVIGSRYRLTTQRLFIERGILSTTTDQLELIRVHDVRVHKSLVDRMCGLGTVELVSTDSTDKSLHIEGITDADRVGEEIRKRMRTMLRKSFFVENI